MRIVFGITIIVGVLVISGCGANTLNVVEPPESAPSSVSTSLPDTPDQAIATPDRINPTMTKPPERLPPTEETAPITGEVPTDLLALIKSDLAERTGIAADAILVIRDQEIVWNDGSLGCPKPGEFYTQSLIQGYWVILEAADVRYDYRVSATGYFFICERGIPPGPPSTPDS